jgi:caffeoyl-CoA O-methyltransferase
MLSQDLQNYVQAASSPVDAVLRDLAAETAGLGDPSVMQISPDQGAFLRILTAAVGVRSAVEVGTFTGYSALCLAAGLAPGGRLLCCDVSEEWTAVARRYWQRAGLADRIDLRLGPAADTLAALPAEPAYDLAFLDADKPGYPTYYELLVPRLRPGGLLLADNVLRHGAVVDPASDDPDVRAVREFNARVAADERVDVVLLPVFDGLTFARKR